MLMPLMARQQALRLMRYADTLLFRCAPLYATTPLRALRDGDSSISRNQERERRSISVNVGEMPRCWRALLTDTFDAAAISLFLATRRLPRRALCRLIAVFFAA